MKKLALILTGITISLSTFSQGKYGATPEDSLVCIESLIYKDYIKSEPKLAMSLWKKAYSVCPGSQKSLYINGVKMYKTLIKGAKDATLQKSLIDTMLSIYDQRIQYFGQEGMVKGMKAQAMMVYRKKETEAIYSLFEEAIALTGNKTAAGTTVGAMFSVINLEKAGKKSKEDVVEMFSKLSDICNANLTGKQAAKYTKAIGKIENVSGPYLNCDALVALAEKSFEAKKDDVDWLRKTVKMLKRKKCYEAPIFAKVADAFFQKEPSAEGAEGMGKLFLGKKNYSQAIDFFKKAVEMAEGNEAKAEYTFSIAQAYLYSRQYAQVRTYAKKALALKSGWGAPYIAIGDAYAASAKSCDDGEIGKYGAYWAAVDKYQKAKAVDGSVSSAANKKIASISSRYPSTKDLFFYGKAKGDTYKVACWINESTTIRTQ